MFDETVSTFFYNDWWEAYYFYPNPIDLDLTIQKNKEYTLSLSFNQDLTFLFKRPSDNSDITFPIEWGNLTVLETSYTGSNGETQTNKALLVLQIGLVEPF